MIERTVEGPSTDRYIKKGNRDEPERNECDRSEFSATDGDYGYQFGENGFSKYGGSYGYGNIRTTSISTILKTNSGT